MSFEVVEPGQFGNLTNPIGEGECSLSKSGKITLLASDLNAAGIGPHYAIVLADADNFRVALRQVRDGEQGKSVAVSIVRTGKKADSGRRSINATRAVKRLGLECEAVAGRYELLTKGDAGAELLIVNLSAATKEDLALAAEGEERAQARKEKEQQRGKR